MGGGSPGDPNDEGGTRKRKKKGTTLNLKDFPEWFSEEFSNVNTEVYVHIKAKEGDVPIARRNRFLVAKILKEKTNNITKASYNAEGDMILRIKGEKEAEKVLAMKTIGAWPVTIEKHKTLNSSKGIIFSRDMCWLTEKEIIEGLSDYKVTEVYFFKRTPKENDQGGNREPRPYGLGVLTFNTQEPPKRIRFGFEFLEVRHYIPNPKRCRKCQKLGHTTKWCKKEEEVCAECGQDKRQNHICGMKMCVNCCKPGHASNSRDCPTYLMEKEVESIKIKQKMTNFEAKRSFFRKYRSLEGYMATINKSMAQIVGSQDNLQSQITTSASNTTAAKDTKEKNTRSNNTGSLRNNNTNIQPELNKDNQKPKGDTTVEEPVLSNNESSTMEQDKLVKENSAVSNRIDSVNRNSYIKLQNWKNTATGITYILDNHIKGEGVPRVDYTRMRGHKTARKERIQKHVTEILSRKEVMKSIVEEVAKSSKCSRILVRVEKGEVRVVALEEEEDSSSEGHSSMDEDPMVVEEV